MSNSDSIRTEQELEDVLGEPMDFIRQKVVTQLDDVMKEFIRRSPLVFVSTICADGSVDVSPKGDPAGFVQVTDEGQLLIPERLGNRLAFGFRNLLSNPQIGLIFVIPNMRETLRVRGAGTLHKDPAVLESMQVKGKPALLYTRVEVQHTFMHCGKAMIRSKCWQPEAWPNKDDMFMARQVAATMGGGAETEELVDNEISKSYEENLY